MRRFLPLMLILGLSACRAGGGGPSSSSPAAGPGALQSSLQAFNSAFQAVSSGLTIAFTEGTKPAGELSEFKHTLLCDTSGPENEGTSNIETRVSDKSVDGTFFVSSNLKNCDDVDGDVSAVGSFTRSADQITFAWDYSGALNSGDCAVDLSDLSISSVGRGPLASSIVSGTLSSDCSGDSQSASVECSWSQTPLDEASLLAGCSCSGSGC